MRPPGCLIELRGRAPVWVYEVGARPEAPTVMLLHGLGASAALNWLHSFPALRGEFHVVAPDHRGHGRTPAGERPFTLEGCADDAFGVADALGVDRFIAVGYSMGGPIAQLMWRKQPHRIDGLVLAATSQEFQGTLIDQLWFRSLPLVRVASKLPGSGPLRTVLTELIATWMTAPADRAWVRDELRRGDVRRLLEAAADLGTFSSRSWIHEIDVPTSVIVAMSDQLVPPLRQLKLARTIEHSVAAFVDGDHFVAGAIPGQFAQVLAHECRVVARRAAQRDEPSPAYWEVLDREMA